jgi:hypothetical protein
MAFSQIAVGDIVNFNGALDTSASSLTVNANVIRDVSKEKVSLEKHVFEGTLQSLAGTSFPTTLSLLIGGANYTVNLPSNTLVLGKNWGALALSSFVVGDTVRVFGSLQTSTSTTINALVVRNASR